MSEIRGFLREGKFIVLNGGKIVSTKIMGKCAELGLISNDRIKCLKSWEGKYKGQRCFIVANGPSLRAEDLELIADEKSFGCNKIYCMYKKTRWRPDFFAILDHDYLKILQNEIFERIDKDTPVFMNDISYNLLSEENKKSHPFVVAKQIPNRHFQPWCKHVNYTYSSNHSVTVFIIETALFLGFSEIYILGLDNTGTTSGNHFEGYHENNIINDIKKKKFHGAIEFSSGISGTEKECAMLREYAEKRGAKIINCTRGGALQSLERKTLEEVLAK